MASESRGSTGKSSPSPVSLRSQQSKARLDPRPPNSVASYPIHHHFYPPKALNALPTPFSFHPGPFGPSLTVIFRRLCCPPNVATGRISSFDNAFAFAHIISRPILRLPIDPIR
ncbi:hypothetical protein TSTA_055030 [Talaromyces stipitatus ATCC 10500]|uniref:Uncharacterized protein n=1 Tax=Talaromyces stipitatus (strain ATCC 10500 / CBS 375.48 / QM 6759 / NRRL 1006) TaxID=441959 RepID=B8MRA1_TALSN|nr:uncharacterized protein TSTA_055030 [Talaromyces stipitatus ATCC 10500]EED12996.1 hypothetical protein TSTA_055030 [Talaromyces stipitatus ATCC 10500]